MVAYGCEDKNRTPVPEERICPVCGEEVEVFVSRGKIIEDWMNREHFEREKKYQAAVAVARSMLARGVINETDFLRIEERLKEKFKPVLGGILL